MGSTPTPEQKRKEEKVCGVERSYRARRRRPPASRWGYDAAEVYRGRLCSCGPPS